MESCPKGSAQSKGLSTEALSNPDGSQGPPGEPGPLKKRKTSFRYKSMEQGYKEMAHINLQYAEDCLAVEWYDAIEYETWLFGV